VELGGRPKGMASTLRRIDRWKILHRPLGIVLGSLVVMAAILALKADMRTLEVGTDTELRTALERATGGETIVIRPGRYGLQYLPKPYRSRVTVRGADRSTVWVEGFSTLTHADAKTAAANILITNLTISPPNNERDAVRINQGAHSIDISEVTIRGGRHCVDINAYPYGSATWPHDVTVWDSDLSRSLGDVVQIRGGRRIAFMHNLIHDPQDNPNDHVDGIQAIGSEELKVVGNWFTEPAEGTSGPNQAIILGRADPYDAALAVRKSYVANNLIYGWRGSGILLAGTEMTWVVNNTSVPYSGQSGFVTVAKNPSARGGPVQAWYNSNLKVWNNIFNKVGAESESAEVFASNNLITDGQAGYGEHSITGRARFVSTAPTSPERYELKRVSPAIDSGITTPDGMTPTTDLDNRRRRGPPDLGAREYLAPADS
jgi:hypothetical protein